MSEPEFLRRRTHPWARADRVAWDKESIAIVPPLVPLIEKLLALRKDVVTQAQFVHGDRSGNVLFGGRSAGGY